MIRYDFDLYPADDPRDGTRLVRFSHLQDASYRDEGNGTGSGRFVIRAASEDAVYIDPDGLQYVRVVEQPADIVRGGFFLEDGDYKALTEDEKEELTFGGTGTLAYLQRAVMASHTYVGAAGALAAYGSGGMDPFDKTWRGYAQGDAFGGDKLGAVLFRFVAEALSWQAGAYTHRHKDGLTYTDTHDDDRTESAIPFVTLGFDGDTDSDGNPWTLPSGEFKAQVGENLLDIVARLMQAGLYIELDPDTFELRAWEAAGHRRDRTGTAWAADVVRFQAPTDGTIATGNIKDEAARKIRANIRRSWLLAGGQDDIYGKATAGSGIPWEGFYGFDAESVDTAEQIAAVQLSARSDAGDNVRLRIKLGDDPGSGYYLPWDHVRPWDVVTLHTGSDEWDWNEAELPVAGLTISLRKGSDWDCRVELGTTYTSFLETGFRVNPPATHSHVLPLCTVQIVNGDTVQKLYKADDAGGDAIAWTDVASNQGGTADGADGTDWYYNLAGSVSIGQVTHSAVAGVEYRVAGWYKRPLGGSRVLALAFYSAAAGHTALTTDPDNLQETALFADAPDPSVWTAFSIDLTAPSGTTSMGLRHQGSGSLDFDEVSITALGSGTTTGTSEITGTSKMIARCDHRHDVHRDTAPTVDDDEDAGFRVGMTWARLNSLSSPTSITAVYILADATAGAAVWLQLPSGGAPTTANYLVGTANGSLSAEIVVGTTPGGELGGTWASPTVDATHSGSTHAATQAAAEATAATALSTHAAAADPHTGYVREADANWVDLTDGGATTLHSHAGGGGSYTDEEAQDAVGAMVADTATVNLTYTDATPELKADVIPGGIKLDDLGTPDDNTDLNASTSAHGLLRKLSGTATQYLDGSGAWSTPAGGGGGSMELELSAYRSSVQSVNHLTDTALIWDNENRDVNTIHDNATNPSRINIVSAIASKAIRVSAQITVSADAIQWQFFIRKNGSTEMRRRVRHIGGTAGVTTAQISQTFYPGELTAGDYLEIIARQGSGSGKNVSSATADAYNLIEVVSG